MAARKLGLCAGGGDVPAAVAERAVSEGREVHVLAFDGVTDPELLAAYPHDFIQFDRPGQILSRLKAAGCQDICMVGGVARPDFKKLRPDLTGISLLPKVIAAARKGDDAILQVLVSFFEGHGFGVLGAHEIGEAQMVVAEGPLGKVQPQKQDQADIEKGIGIVKAIGALDIGQGAVLRQGHVIAVEAAEGTDAMLDRCAGLTGGDSIGRGGVLIKWPKPQQDHRVDMPTIGPKTVELAAAAGLNGIAVCADATLVIDRPAVQRLANDRGMFVLGVAAENGPQN